MSLSYFYSPGLGEAGSDMELDEVNSRHAVQVLRMREGDPLLLTDGLGAQARASVLSADKRRCRVRLADRTFHPRQGPEVHIGISPLKNTSRFEWFLEKATEIGVAGFIPLICERTERGNLRPDRLNSILIAAMLQSQQVWLPILSEAQDILGVLGREEPLNRYIAHCLEGEKRMLPGLLAPRSASMMLIGPEGDFSAEEVKEALSRDWIPVSLGETRLRTETAGIVAVTLLRLGQL